MYRDVSVQPESSSQSLPVLPQGDITVQWLYDEVISQLLYRTAPTDPKITASMDEHGMYHRRIDGDRCKTHDVSRFSAQAGRLFDRVRDLSPTRKPDVLNPINDYDWTINALRILQGLCLIAELEKGSRDDRTKAIQQFVRGKYAELNAHYASGKVMSQWTADWLKHEANALIEKQFSVDLKQAAMQVLLARDNCLLLEKQVPVVTTVKNTSQNLTTTLGTAPQKVNDLYETHFYDKDGNGHQFKTDQPWYQHQFKQTGLINAECCWLQKFYQNHAETIMKYRQSTVASERYKPLPSSYHFNKVAVDKVFSNNVKVRRKAAFLSVGTVVPIQFHQEEKQRDARLVYAIGILKSLLEQHLPDALKRFVKQYQGLLENKDSTNFYFNYSTLLTPFLWDIVGEGGDENDNFEMIEIAKEALLLIEKEQWQEENSLLRQLKQQYSNINVCLTHTNHRINKWSDTHSFIGSVLNSDMADYAEEDTAVFEDQLGWVAMLPDQLKLALYQTQYKACYLSIRQYIQGSISSNQFNLNQALQFLAVIEQSKDTVLCDSLELQVDLVLRLRASIAMRMLMEGHPSFNQLSHDQRDLMRSGLSLHMMGDQSLEVRGCKSKRERYGLSSTVYTAMLEEPKAMFDWQVLRNKIPAQVRHGHVIATTSAHVAGCNKLWLLKDDYAQSCQDIADASRVNSTYIKPKPKVTLSVELSTANYALTAAKTARHWVNNRSSWQRLPLKAAALVAGVTLGALLLAPAIIVAPFVMAHLYKQRKKMMTKRDETLAATKAKRDQYRGKIKTLKRRAIVLDRLSTARIVTEKKLTETEKALLKKLKAEEKEMQDDLVESQKDKDKWLKKIEESKTRPALANSMASLRVDHQLQDKMKDKVKGYANFCLKLRDIAKLAPTLTDKASKVTLKKDGAKHYLKEKDVLDNLAGAKNIIIQFYQQLDAIGSSNSCVDRSDHHSLSGWMEITNRRFELLEQQEKNGAVDSEKVAELRRSFSHIKEKVVPYVEFIEAIEALPKVLKELESNAKAILDTSFFPEEKEGVKKELNRLFALCRNLHDKPGMALWLPDAKSTVYEVYECKDDEKNPELDTCDSASSTKSGAQGQTPPGSGRSSSTKGGQGSGTIVGVPGSHFVDHKSTGPMVSNLIPAT